MYKYKSYIHTYTLIVALLSQTFIIKMNIPTMTHHLYALVLSLFQYRFLHYLISSFLPPRIFFSNLNLYTNAHTNTHTHKRTHTHTHKRTRTQTRARTHTHTYIVRTFTTLKIPTHCPLRTRTGPIGPTRTTLSTTLTTGSLPTEDHTTATLIFAMKFFSHRITSTMTRTGQPYGLGVRCSPMPPPRMACLGGIPGYLQINLPGYFRG